MEQYNDNSSILYERLYDSVTGNPIIIPTTEVQECNNHGIITLSLIPNESEGLEFPELNNMHEVYNAEDVVGENDFYCNYKRGDVYLHESKWHKKHKISYKGEGISFIGANRVYTQRDKDGNVVQTLDYIIEKGMEAIESLLIIGSAIQVLYRLEQDIADGNELHTNLQSDISTGEPLHTQLRKDINDANTFKDQLNEDVADGKILDESLKIQNPRAEQNLANLNKAMTDCADDIANITKTDNGVAIVTTANWGTADSEGFYHCTVTHTANSKDLNLNIFDYTDNVQGESVMVTVTPLTDTTFKVSSIENTPIKIVFASGYYGGYTSANTRDAINSLGTEKQNKTDNLLTTTSKVIPLAINEVKSSLEETNIQVNNKVEKVVGKGLSTNDYTTDDKNLVSLIPNKVEKAYVDERIATNANGSPDEIFQYVSILKSTYPNGDDRPKLVTVNDVLHVYLWDGSDWIKGGVYQAQAIADKSVTSTKRTAIGEYGFVVGDPVNFDFKINQVVFSGNNSTHRVYFRNQVYTIPSNTIVDLTLSGTTKSAKLYFNTSTGLINKYLWNITDISEDEILIASYSISTTPETVYFSGNYIVNGIKPISIENGYLEKGINFNLSNRTVIIPTQRLVYGEEFYSIDSELVLSYSTTGGYGKLLVFNIYNKTIYIKSDSLNRTYEIVLAYWRVNEEVNAFVNGDMTINNNVNNIGSNYFLNYKPINIDMDNKKINFNVASDNKCILFYNNGTFDIPTSQNEVNINIADTSIVKVYFNTKNKTFNAVKWNSNATEKGNILVAIIKTTEPYNIQMNAQFTINNKEYNGIVDKYVQGDIVLDSLEDCIDSWWVYPLSYKYKGMRDNTYIGYTTSEGYSGVATINNKDGKVTKKHLKKGVIDDHNGVSVMVMQDGKVLTAYCGHNEDKFAHIRISKHRECIEEFEDDILIPFPATTSYTQLFYKDNRYHLFTRVSGSEWMWMYTSSADGRVWATPKKLLKSSLQYYLKVTDTTHPNVLKLVMYSNPQVADTNIRLGYFNIKTGEILNADYSTVIGNISEDSGILKDNFTIVVPKGDKTLRLLDVAITGTSKTIIAYAEFTTKDDIVYKVATYESSNTTYSNTINAGQPFYVPSTYVGGVIFLNENTLIVSKENEGLWYIEKWTSSDGINYIKTQEVEKTITGITATRPFKVVNTENEFLYSLGEYNNQDYTKFYTDLVKR